MSKFFWDILSKVRNLDWLGGGLIMSTATAILVAVISYIETIPWTFKIPALMLAVCCSLWFWLNWPKFQERLSSIGKGAQPQTQAELPLVRQVQISDKEEAHVEIALISNWEPPFCLRKIGKHGAQPERYAEELCLRLTAYSNLKNVSVRLTLKSPMAVIRSFKLKDNELSGDVSKGMSEDIVVYSNEFELYRLRLIDSCGRRDSRRESKQLYGGVMIR